MVELVQDKQKFFGTIKKIIYSSPAGEFKIGVLEVVGGHELTFKGALPGLDQGHLVWLSGTFEQSATHGNTFVVKDFGWDRPLDPVGIERYLASGFFKGIGPALAHALVAHLGVKTLEIIESGDVDTLAKVPKVGLGRAQAICKGASEHKHISQIMVFLRAHQISTLLAKKIYYKLGSQAVELLEQNPYVLVDLIEGVGFKKADEIAMNFGIEPNDPMRVFFAMKFALWKEFKCGTIYISLESFYKLTIDLLGFGQQNLELLLQVLNQALERKDFVVVENIASQDFQLVGALQSLSGSNLYIALARGFGIEKALSERIARFLNYQPKFSFDQNYLYKQFCAQLVYRGKKFELSDEQKEALCSVLALQEPSKAPKSKVSVITGGPGTGKTTILRALVVFLKQQKIKFAIAAPTGKAAKRITQTTGVMASTIHRLLEYDPSGGLFLKNEQNCLSIDILIVDETSMVDLFLANAIFKSLSSNARVLFLGDVDQLPSIGPGQFFADLIKSGLATVVTLTKIFRQASESEIILAAHKINACQIPSLRTNHDSDFVFYNSPEQSSVCQVLEEVLEALKTRSIDYKDWIVLAPMHVGTSGTKNINQYLQRKLNPITKGQGMINFFDSEFREGDPVMQMKNNYDKEVFNGDVGIISEIVFDQKVIVNFDSKLVEYTKFELKDLSLAYAASIHKSQGSEFKAVTILIFMQHFHLLSKRLIYTAVTRATDFCSIIGQKQAMAASIKSGKNKDRVSLLCNMLIKNQ